MAFVPSAAGNIVFNGLGYQAHMLKKGPLQVVLVLLAAALLTLSAPAATVSPKVSRVSPKAKPKVTESSRTAKRMTSLGHSRPVASTTKKKKTTAKRRGRRRYYERFYTSSFADDLTTGDITGGEDPVVRQAAIDALGNMNGTVVALDPMSGRMLAMVNQKLALSEGAPPCSTVKLAVALAALSENIITRDTRIALGPRWKMDLTDALAHSNNQFFEALGRRLGFEKVSYYAHQFGLGELAGYNIEGEHLGVFPDAEIDARLGGVGKMCSFGEGISMTPLQLGALVAAIANGGTLYYLQHPTSPEEIAGFQPKVKRYLDIANLIPEMSPGMMGAVDYGTARSVRYSFNEEQILGKTGTCSKDGTRFGWFASYANTQYGKIVVVIFLQGGRPTFGPKAAEIAGHLYRNLYDHSFFVSRGPLTPTRTTTAAGVSQ
jgi:beta-lactamase class D